MHITFFIGLAWAAEFIAEAMLFVFMEYKFLAPLRWFFGFVVATDLIKFAARDNLSLYAALWGLCRIIELCWLVWIAADLYTLLVPLSERAQAALKGILYTIVMSAAFVNGPPVSMNKFIAFQQLAFGTISMLLFLGIIAAARVRFCELAEAILVGVVAESVVGLLMLRHMYLPVLGQLASLGLCLMIMRAVVRYVPLGMDGTTMSSAFMASAKNGHT